MDAVLSEDVDTIMFGSGITIRNWSAEGKGKIPTHVNIYDSTKIKASSGLDREGMVLIAMMSGGDYIPEGIPGCGPKTACEAARAGFGAKLCKIERGDKKAFEDWKENLAHELRSNESKFFRVKHGSLQIPESFPSKEILRYYTHPAISSLDSIRELGRTLVWEKPMDLPGLRNFTDEAFKWETVIGAKKFIRTLAPGLLVRELRLGSESAKSNLIQNIHQARQHASTDNTSELRISYIPHHVVDIDLSIERPEEGELEDGEDDEALDGDEVPSSTQQRPYLFDPSEVTKLWVLDHFVRLGARKKYDEFTLTKNAKVAKATTLAAQKPKTQATKKGLDATMPTGAIYQFAGVTKSIASVSEKSHTIEARRELPFPDLPASSYSNRLHEPFRNSKAPARTRLIDVIDLAGSSPTRPTKASGSSNTAKATESTASTTMNRPARAPLQRSRTEGSRPLAVETLDLTADTVIEPKRREPLSRGKSTSKRKAQVYSPLGTPKASKKSSNPMGIVASPMRQDSITKYFSPSPPKTRLLDMLDLTQSSPTRETRTLFSSKIMPRQNTSLQVTSRSLQPAPLFSASSKDAASEKSVLNPPGHSSTVARTQAPQIMAVHSIDLTSPLPLRSRPRVTSTFAVTKTSPSKTATKPVAAQTRGRLESCDANSQRIRLRESLKGAFAIEQDNGTSITKSRTGQSIWKLEDVVVLDLTSGS